MRIAVDARNLSEPITGISRYASSLLCAMMRRGRQHEWLIYSYLPLRICLPSEARAKVRTLELGRRAMRVAWAHTVLPTWAAWDRAELFFSLATRLPLCGVRVAQVVVVYDLVWRFFPETMRRGYRLSEQLLNPHALRRADALVAISEATATDCAAELPQTRGKLHVVHAGVTELPSRRDPDVLRRLEIDRPYVLFVGTMEPRKNLRRLLQAFARLPERTRSAHQLVVCGGRGWGNESVDSVARQLGIEAQTRVLGYQSDEVVATLIERARVLAMPSLYEGFGIPLLEAMSLGTPTLTSATSSMPEVVGDAAELVDPRDVAAISDGLGRLLGDEALRVELAQRGRRRAMRFSWDASAEKVLALFEEIGHGSVAGASVCDGREANER